MHFGQSLHKLRLQYQPKLPKALEDIARLVPEFSTTAHQNAQISEMFPSLSDQKIITFQKGEKEHGPLKVGVVFSGGPAPGGHNVVSGLFDALKKLNKQSLLYGFLNGPGGIVSNSSIEITETIIADYRNQGGFDLLGTGRTKIETLAQFESAEQTVRGLDLDGLVIVGGDDSNTNAAFLADYFLSHDCKTKVVGVPKTIDGDLKNEYIEVSFGFDTASKVYSEIIGNLLRDALSAKKYYFFIKMMGRTASHQTLECALQTNPNMALISEEVAAEKKTLQKLVGEITELIVARAEQKKDFGGILIPEGIIEFIPEFKQLISELNAILGEHPNHQKPTTLLSPDSARVFDYLPHNIQEQLLLDRDPHGNVQVSKIDTERLFIDLVAKELKNRKDYKGKFNAQPIFCGYEGRSGYPTNFDCQYTYALGFVAALLIERGATGYMACIQKLSQPTEDWVPSGIPLISMMHVESRGGKSKAVIQKALVDLNGEDFKRFKEMREDCRIADCYLYPGPIQY